MHLLNALARVLSRSDPSGLCFISLVAVVITAAVVIIYFLLLNHTKQKEQESMAIAIQVSFFTRTTNYYYYYMLIAGGGMHLVPYVYSSIVAAQHARLLSSLELYPFESMFVAVVGAFFVVPPSASTIFRWRNQQKLSFIC